MAIGTAKLQLFFLFIIENLNFRSPLAFLTTVISFSSLILGLTMIKMNPLSIIASCVAVAGAGGAVVKGLKKLRDLTKVPDVILSIINEVADLTLVVQDIRLNFQLHQSSLNISQASMSVINHLLDRAQSTLLKLDQVINYRLLSPSGNSGEVVFRRSAWIFEEQHVRRLQSSLRTTRLDIATKFAALTLYASL